MTERSQDRNAERAERRRNVARLRRGEGLGPRAIARRLSVPVTTVHRDLVRLGLVDDATPGETNAPPAPSANLRALKSGVNSERMIAPVRAEHAAELARRFPWMDSGRRAIQSQRLAQIDLAATWIDAKGGVVRDEEGRIFDVADKLARWLVAAEAWYARAEQERREIRSHDALAEVMGEAEDDGAATA